MSPEAEIRRRIRGGGPITFAEFMELALYWPGGGYYAGGTGAGEPFGAAGDYYTSPLAHPAFGALLAVQLYQCWRLLGEPQPFFVAEQGAGNGQLGRDVAAAAGQLPGGFGDALRYVGIDRGTAPGLELGGERPGVARVMAAGLPLRGRRGVILSNELLDAFPVHQVRREQGKLREVYIAVEDGGALVERLDEPSTPALAARFAELGVELAEGQTAEVNLQLEGWAAEAAAALDAGLILTIDYGRLAAELYDSRRRLRGTLTTYYRHTQTDAPLQRIGRQDMTAQVDFTAVVNAGCRAGLTPLGFTSQGRLLRNLGFDQFRRRLADLPLSRGELAANRAGLMALVNPDGLGDFKALAQGKGVGQPDLWGFVPSQEAAALTAGLAFPYLTERHIALPWGWAGAGEGEVDLDWEGLWEGRPG